MTLLAAEPRLNYESGGITQSLAYALTETDRDNLSEGVSAFGAEGELERWEYQLGLTALPGFDLIAGVDLEREVNGSDERDNSGVYAEVLSDFSDSWFLTLGLRQDDNDGLRRVYQLSRKQRLPH